jgi:diguanylate cyclase (GGDEF)-like protein
VKLNKGVALRWLLIVPFILQVVVLGFSGWLLWQRGQDAVQYLVSQLQDRLSDRIQDYVKSYLDSAARINSINAQEIADGKLDLDNPQQLISHFITLHAAFKQVNHISVGRSNGTYIAVRRSSIPKNFDLLWVKPDDLGNLTKYQVSPAGEIIRLKEITRKYDPRLRPWYQQALQATKPAWSNIYRYFDVKTLGISHLYPVENNGQITAVLATDFDLGELNRFLQNLEIKPRGQAFIMERDQLLVASSQGEELFKEDQPGDRVTAAHSQDPLIRATAAALERQPQITHKYQLLLQHRGQEYFLRFIPLSQLEGLDWLLVVILPKADFVAQVYRNTYWTLGLFAGILLVTGGLGVVLLSGLSGQILEFSRQAGAIAAGQLAPPPPVASFFPVQELITLGQAFQKMRQQLQDSFTALAETNRCLETKVEQRTQALLEANTALQKLATQDPLTGIANRRHFDDYLQQQWENAETISLILCDVDHFKIYNDTYGHEAGDRCLQQVVQAISQAVTHPQALIARYGGEEFAVVLPQTTSDQAQEIAKQILRAVSALAIPHERSPVANHVTLSLGICSLRASPNQFFNPLIRSADHALYEAKAAGRNTYRARSL